MILHSGFISKDEVYGSPNNSFLDLFYIKKYLETGVAILIKIMYDSCIKKQKYRLKIGF